MGVLHEAIHHQNKHEPKPLCQQHKPTPAIPYTGSHSKTLSPNSLRSTDGRLWGTGSRSAAFSLIHRSTPASSFFVKHPGPEKKWKTGISSNSLPQRETKHSLNLPRIKRPTAEQPLPQHPEWVRNQNPATSFSNHIVSRSDFSRFPLSLKIKVTRSITPSILFLNVFNGSATKLGTTNNLQ